MPSDRTLTDDAGDDLTRRQRDLDEAREQLVATGQILTAIGTSASDLEAVLGIDGYRRFSTELFWPQTEHTYPLELHRRRLIDGVKNWARAFVQPIRAPAIAQRTGDIEPRELAGDAYCVAQGAPEELIRT